MFAEYITDTRQAATIDTQITNPIYLGMFTSAGIGTQFTMGGLKITPPISQSPPVSPPISQSLSWTPVVAETPITHIVIEDVVSQSNVMTIGSGIVASTDTITKYWAFAVKNSDAVDFTDSNTELTNQIETFI